MMFQIRMFNSVRPTKTLLRPKVAYHESFRLSRRLLLGIVTHGNLLILAIFYSTCDSVSCSSLAARGGVPGRGGVATCILLFESIAQPARTTGRPVFNPFRLTSDTPQKTTQDGN